MCPDRRGATGLETDHSLRRPYPADDGPLRQARAMTTPDAPTPEGSTPQPRDIALEQETPEQAADLETQSDPAPGAEES
jgi:hypothetical protein